MNPLLLVDYYKTEHHRMMPKGTTKIYSNLTPRKSRMESVDHVVFFGLQHFVLKYLIKSFNKKFFNKPLKKILKEYKRHVKLPNYSHIAYLHGLGFLPIEIKALEEGTLCPIRVPCLTITNTDPNCAWLVNYLETLMSCMLWQPITSATIANEYRKILSAYAKETTGSDEGVQWQGHDFSMRGMSSVESSILSGMGHLLSFTGTDTIPAIYQLESSYDAKGLIGASVPATEHSVMCMGEKESELDTFRRLLSLYPTGILSVVSDTWDLWKVLTEYLPALKGEILARDGKLVIRPDSGDPVDIICGNCFDDAGTYRPDLAGDSPAAKGVIELLWDVFGGTINEQGYKVLHPCIGAIYGDSISIPRAIAISERLKAKGFATTNIVYGIGSFTYQYNTRDTFGFAVKATYGELMVPDEEAMAKTDTEVMVFKTEAREIFKDPITDDGTKKSLRGLLSVGYGDSKKIEVMDRTDWKGEQSGLLKTVFLNGLLVSHTNLEEIRARLRA